MGEMSPIATARWGRLLPVEDAAAYLGISPTTMRGLGIATRCIGRRVLYDIRELDRYVDRMGDAPIPTADVPAAAAAQEAEFFLNRRHRGAH